jgi:L-aminopeptidase/D-esterase-like protein
VTLTSVPGIRVGHAEVPGGGSGCTVVLGPFRGAVEVLGLATGSRELDVLSPYHLADRVNAILLTGGSAFGLAAAEGVMEWLEERGEGFDTGRAKVPLVPAAVIFDLGPGVGRPGPGEGRRACEAAGAGPVQEGAVGAGAGATVGKILGTDSASPGGVGSTSRRMDEEGMGNGTLGALAVVNALGDVVAGDGRVLAGSGGVDVEGIGGWGPRSRGGSKGGAGEGVVPGASTTLAVVATDLPLSRVELGRLARLAATALPRAISPVNTPFDGDMVFAVSTGEWEESTRPEEVMAAGVMARDLLEDAIRRAVSANLRGVLQRAGTGS